MGKVSHFPSAPRLCMPEILKREGGRWREREREEINVELEIKILKSMKGTEGIGEGGGRKKNEGRPKDNEMSS